MSGKEDTKMCFVISRIKLWRFWWNLVHSFLNKFAAKWFHLIWNDVSTLPCVHALPLNCYRRKLQNLSHLNCYPRIRQIWIQLITACDIARKKCTKHRNSSGAIDDATDEWLPQWRHDPAWLTPFSVAVSLRPHQWWCVYTPSLTVFSARSNQLGSNLANL